MKFANHTYSPSTVKIAEEYLIVITNERPFYQTVMNVLGSIQSVEVVLSAMPYHVPPYFRNYLKQVEEKDKCYFKKLVKKLVWEYYAPEYSPELYREYLLSCSQIHIEKANQHLKNVENIMNTLDKYKNETSIEVTLVHGKPVEDYTESELVALIEKAKKTQESCKELAKESKRMKAKYDKCSKDIEVYVAALDSLPE